MRWTGTLTPPAPGDYSFEIADRRCDPSEDHENYTLKVEGRATRNSAIEIAADDTWGLMIAPTGEALPLQIY